MFNSNIPASSLLSIDSGGLLMGGHTPKTPEILNSLIAMTNPLENFSYSSAAAAAAAVSVASSSASCSAASTPVVTVRHFNGHPNGQVSDFPHIHRVDTCRILNVRILYMYFQSHSQDSSHSSCSGSPLDSPAGTATTPSVQQVNQLKLVQPSVLLEALLGPFLPGTFTHTNIHSSKLIYVYF